MSVIKLVPHISNEPAPASPTLAPSPAQTSAPILAQPTASAGAGHRDRLKEKFLQGNGIGLADYEMLELTLTYAIPRKDVKPLAKQLLKEFKTLDGVLNASAAELKNVKGLGAHSVGLLQLVGALARRIGKEKLAATPMFENKLALYDYLYAMFANKTREEVHVLYLSSSHQLIIDETLFTGTLTQSLASPRDILKRALAHNAAGIVLAHNHPSGIPTPSEADHIFTNALNNACQSMNITLHDHLVVGKNQIYSFRSSKSLS